MYPKDWGRSTDDAGAIYFGNKFIADHSAVAHALNKPFLLGEYGHNSGSGDGVDAWVLQSWVYTMQQSSVMTDAASYWMMWCVQRRLGLVLQMVGCRCRKIPHLSRCLHLFLCALSPPSSGKQDDGSWFPDYDG
jgi:hypothetical protein